MMMVQWPMAWSISLGGALLIKIMLPPPPALRRLVPYLQEKGVGIINASVLSMGLLTHQARQGAGGRSRICMKQTASL